MKIREIGFVVYPVTSLEKARPFYENVLGLVPTVVHEGGGMGWVEYDIASGTLAIGAGSPQFQPSAGGGCAALEVEDFEESVARLRGHSVNFVIEPMETPVCYMAGFSDPDGNTLMLHRRKAKPAAV